MLVNTPPANIVGPANTRLRTLEFAFGFQGRTEPVAASSAAARLRGWPPMVAKSPPTYSLPPLSTRELTVLSVPGFQGVGLPLASRWARLARGCPRTATKYPPMYQPPEPSGTATSTVPTTMGTGCWSEAVVASRSSAPPDGGPTL